MPRKSGAFALALALVVLPAMPALAAWKLAPGGVQTSVAGRSLRVTPAEDWNRSGGRLLGPDRDEVWTLDGPNLNELRFFVLDPGDALFDDKEGIPLARAMQPAAVPDFYARSLQAALGTPVRVTIAEPTEFAGHSGVRFAFEYTMPGRSLVRRGIAKAALAGGRLYLITFIAPSVYYFDRDAPKAELIMDSAHF